MNKIEFVGKKKDLITQAKSETNGFAYSYKVDLAFNLNFQDTLEKVNNILTDLKKDPLELNKAAQNLIKLVEQFKTESNQLRESIIRLNDTTLPELEERLDEKLNNNLDKYLNELTTVKKDILNKLKEKDKQ